ncbi:MAG: hypothetical protein EOL95_09060 [Bacteroidia bacterium]|nr:hypothetical protein [Bacteroidia bacterium]
MGLDHGFIHKKNREEEINYTFRKANHIHAYIINKFHNGVDDQKDFKIPITGIEEFRDILNRVINSLENTPKKTIKVKSGWANGQETYIDIEVFKDTSIAQLLLPTQSGFFFGGTEYDDWYLKDCKEALEMCDKILTSKPKGTVTYWCWW